MTAVLDSWAVLRYLEDTEPAAQAVAELLDCETPLMSWINLGEVHYVLRRLHGKDDATETVRDLRDVIDARLPDERVVLDAARIKAAHPMAYADAFAVALAMAQDATLWTADPELLLDGAAWRWRDLRSDQAEGQGLRPIQIWVPDVRSPRFTEEAHRQSAAVASSERAADDQAFIDAIGSEEA